MAAPPSIKLFIFEGSQFCAKVIAALDSRKLSYTTVDVPFTSRAARRKVLPSGGHMVPEMTIDSEVIPDSTAILKRIDELCVDKYEPLFPSEQVAEAEQHISETINALVLYFNHVSDDGWHRTIRAKLASFFPPILRNFIPYALLMKSARENFRVKVSASLSVSPDGDRDLNDGQMTKRLVYELARYEDVLEKKPADASLYLYNTSLPSAADCSLYAMMMRFVSDKSVLPPALPDLWKEDGLKNLQSWYDKMEKEHPIVWKRVAEQPDDKRLARG